ncbi:hypothetical protein HDV62DRAFT_68307, partial [Trichoderma sp. SZMC 28011]
WQAPGASLQLPARGNVTWQFSPSPGYVFQSSYYLAVSWQKSVWKMQMAINSCEFYSPPGGKLVFFNSATTKQFTDKEIISSRCCQVCFYLVSSSPPLHHHHHHYHHHQECRTTTSPSSR